ncbi:SDR family NAD(P)-dependent oxidoreductase [Rhodococcus sp. LB1]|uniref:SDR family NAD(P)-dependent oxidoreductase n=1 Tax=Rhodococcus sp. LB1 TaxID=1807499 RepID=UPI00077A220B|nr:SDR family NAD(P)-dependent oxidoreductase [Rhodococcus sp. LB1]KXX54144.1 3-hydroxyacyl-CoA dehydrogenase [Rhodococcus sp. LB1]TQC48180.1 SDR family NAD(P)-dependent oxidoreductase [Rhodococcus sp. WS4]
MSTSLAGQVVVVTGAGGGLGRDFALQMGAEGASVVVNDTGVELDGSGGNASRAQSVVDEITAQGGSAVASTDSVAGWESARQIVQTAVDTFGRIDAVVNNAGIVRDRMIFKMSEEEWRAVIDVHLHGSFFVSRAAADYFKKQESGAYVHMTSTSGLIGAIGQANYSAAKLGIVGLSRSIANEMARYGVRSNCIAPFAWSRMTSSIPTDTPEQRARVEKLQLMQGSKVAPLAAYLVSDGSNVSGQVFAVRANEIYLMSQHRPARTMHRSEGWTVETIGEHLIPALNSSFTPLEVTTDVISWDPV